MKKYPVFISIGLSLIIAVPAILAIFCGYQPEEELTESFFLVAEEDEKGNEGWRVYENRQGREKELVNNGYAGYTGVDASEQTLYFSKKLPEKPCDSLMLEIWSTFCSVSVFLDNQVIYSDFPELDNRIGWLELPTPAYEREKPILLSLPPDYQGKTLTIAQSYIGNSEKQETDTTFYPCGVRMHYDYGYENRIIWSASETMISAMFFFLLSMLLLALFIGNAFVGNLSFPVFSLALMSAMLMGRQLVLAPFYHQYFGYPTLDYSSILYYCSIGGQLLFFASIFRKFKGLIWTLAGCQGLTVVLFAMAQEGFFVEYAEWHSFLMGFPSLMGVVCLATVLVCVFIQGSRKEPLFVRMRNIVLGLAAGTGIWLAARLLIEPEAVSALGSVLLTEIQWLSPYITLRYLLFLCMAAGILAYCVELIEQRIRFRAEKVILVEKSEMAMESYENLRRQTEEVMMLRHDTVRHYTLLQTLTEKDSRQAYEYLEELIGQMKQVHPVVCSDNEMLDIIVNGKLALAMDKGIATEIVRCETPEKLPMTDAEMCSLFMNILDNAIAGASCEKVDNPYLKLDFHCNGQHFIFSCENSAVPEREESVSREHYGLKIIQKIMKKWGEMVSVETDGNRFKISVAIPLS